LSGAIPAALGLTPARPDAAVTAYVRQHQPWVPLQARGIERFSDSNPDDTSFFVFTTIRPYTDQSEARRVCVAVANDLRSLHLAVSLSVLGRPEATMAWDSSQHSCGALVPAALDNAKPAPASRVAALVGIALAALERQQGQDVTDLSCRPPATPGTGATHAYRCSFSTPGIRWRCSVTPTASTVAGRETRPGLGTYACSHPLR
jgi:hypothetical protein